MLYEYICDNCNFTDSFFHKMEENPEIICPECGEKMRKALGINFVLNGYSYNSGNKTSNAKRIKQTVMGVPKEKVKDLDKRITSMPRVVPKDPV